MAKLTKSQVAVLVTATEHVRFGINYYQAASVGGNGRTLDALERAGLLTKRRFSSGSVWEITDAGRAALARQKP